MNVNLASKIAVLVLGYALGTMTRAETLNVPGFAIHYSLFPSTFLEPGVAQQYGIVRASDRALLHFLGADELTKHGGRGGGGGGGGGGVRAVHEILFNSRRKFSACEVEVSADAAARAGIDANG